MVSRPDGRDGVDPVTTNRRLDSRRWPRGCRTVGCRILETRVVAGISARSSSITPRNAQSRPGRQLLDRLAPRLPRWSMSGAGCSVRRNPARLASWSRACLHPRPRNDPRSPGEHASKTKDTTPSSSTSAALWAGRSLSNIAARTALRVVGISRSSMLASLQRGRSRGSPGSFLGRCRSHNCRAVAVSSALVENGYSRSSFVR